MPDRSALSSARLFASRARARVGLLVSAAITVAVAVATVGLVLAWLARPVTAFTTPPPGVSADEVATQIEVGVVALASAAPALVVLVALLAGTAVAQLARLIAAAREHETAALQARGQSRAQRWITDAGEGVTVAASGAVAGVSLAAASATVAGIEPRALLAQWPWALGTAVLLAAIFTVALRRGEGRPATRAAPATTAVLVLVVLLAAALVVWQLPLARGAGFDPIVAIAPAVTLLAGAIAALAVFGILAVAWSRPAAAAPGVAPGYPARQVARRLPIYAAAVLLVALTVAQSVFASAYGATWQAMSSESAALRSGADLRVDTPPDPVTPGDIAAAAAIEGVDAASPALVSAVKVGATTAQLTAAPQSAIGPVVTAAGGIIDKQTLSAVSSVEGAVSANPLPLGQDATGIRILADLSAPSVSPPITVSVILIDATGAPITVPFEPAVRVTDGGTATLAAEIALPPGTAPWRLLAVVASGGAIVSGGTATVTIRELAAVGGAALDVTGEVVLDKRTPTAVMWLADGGALARGEEAPPLAVAVTPAFAERIGLTLGGVFEFRYDGSGRRGVAVISRFTDAVPGVRTIIAAFAPMENLLVSQLQRGALIVPPNSIWAAGPASADEFSAVFGDRRVETSQPGIAAGIVGALVPGWWIATAGAALLSLIAAFAIVQTLAISRRRELGVLRALGVPPRQQAAMRAGELGGVAATALVLGVGAGALVSWLIVPALVRAVTPGVLPLVGGVSVDIVPLAAAVGLLLGGLALIVVAEAFGVARGARATIPGEESR